MTTLSSFRGHAPRSEVLSAPLKNIRTQSNLLLSPQPEKIEQRTSELLQESYASISYGMVLIS